MVIFDYTISTVEVENEEQIGFNFFNFVNFVGFKLL